MESSQRRKARAGRAFLLLLVLLTGIELVTY
jgi:hypothetical protein